MPPTEDLVALWKTTNRQRFQNYRAIFSVLNTPIVSRNWLKVLDDKVKRFELSPKTWKKWVEIGTYELLRSEPTTIIRSLQQQTPDSDIKTDILRTVFDHFKQSSIAFEHFSARIFQMQDPRLIIDEVTRGTIDGGKDAIGRYRLGFVDDPVHVEFALEAKCYQPQSTATRQTRLCQRGGTPRSRLRHRQFGVLVTTSVIARQAYQEVREDRHPIVFISGKDIADTLVSCGYSTSEQVRTLLKNEFPALTQKDR
jgi:hypothetical protein